MSASRKIQATKNYRLFGRSDQNRPLNLKKHRRLEESMKKYGFLPCFPIVCVRDGKGNLIVKDGQHRLTFAETLGLTIFWVEEAIDFDVAIINTTSKVWGLKDYAQKHAANGLKAYQEGIEFTEQHDLPIGTAFALLAGSTNYSNIQEQFTSGAFKIKDRTWADSVASIYVPVVTMAPALKNARFIEACMAVCRVEGFDQKRMIHGAESCREKLVAYSTRDAYLDMLQEIYNFRRSKLVALKVEATMAMRQRNPAANGKSKKSNRPASILEVCK